jgi:hypothetical protein
MTSTEVVTNFDCDPISQYRSPPGVVLSAVFDNIERHGLGPRPYEQPDFIYLNKSARPGVEAIRAAFENWFLRYPNEDRAELRARLRSEDNYQHRSAFFELFLHEMLLRLGCNVQVHPRKFMPM